MSTSTAARVLRDGPNRVNEDLTARVLQAAEGLGYTPNLMARSLRAGSPPLIGLMVGDMLDPYFAAIGEYVTVEADSLGLAAMVANMRRDPIREIELLQRFLQHRVSGVLLSGGGYDQDSQHDVLARTVASLETAGCHVASLTDRRLDVPTFSIDNEAVGSLVAQTVLRGGHSKVAVVYAPTTSEVTRRRRTATLQALEEGGATVQETVARYSREAGFEAAAQIFRGRRAAWPTALIAGSDSLAVGALAWLAACEVSVPDEVSIIGVGDTYAAETLRLSSVDVALEERSKAAVNHLAALIEGREQPQWEGVQPQLLDRGSVAPARSH